MYPVIPIKKLMTDWEARLAGMEAAIASAEYHARNILSIKWRTETVPVLIISGIARLSTSLYPPSDFHLFNILFILKILIPCRSCGLLSSYSCSYSCSYSQNKDEIKSKSKITSKIVAGTVFKIRQYYLTII